MPEASDWSTLKQRCEDNNATLIFRAETFDGAYRLSLAAVSKDKKLTAREALRYDVRAELGDSAPQSVISGMVNQALEEWFA